MALHGILECYKKPTQHFGGIICTSGSGSPRGGAYASLSDQEIAHIRQKEQHHAARIGSYLFMAQLEFSSSSVQGLSSHSLVDALHEILQQLQPEVIYTHHPLDKHPTHRAICYAVIEALKRLPATQHPKQLLGGEVWRSLDWLTDDDKISLDVSAHPELREQLISVFDSQISGGKHYDLAALGRYRANATFSDPHTADLATHVAYALNLRPLLENPQLSLQEFALSFADRFCMQIKKELS